jgi:hypothetical protein
MSTVTIVVVGIWNTVLVSALAAVIHWRQRVLEWITQSDAQSRTLRDDQWAAFLADHPELTDR